MAWKGIRGFWTTKQNYDGAQVEGKGCCAGSLKGSEKDQAQTLGHDMTRDSLMHQ